MLKKYRCTVKMGHMGSGRFIDGVVEVNAHSAIEAMEMAKSRKGVKKGRLFQNGESVLKVELADFQV